MATVSNRSGSSSHQPAGVRQQQASSRANKSVFRRARDIHTPLKQSDETVPDTQLCPTYNYRSDVPGFSMAIPRELFDCSTKRFNGEHQRGVFSVNCRTGISWPYNFRAISSLSLCVDIGPFSARTCRMIQSRDHWKICSARATLTCIGIASISSLYFR